MKRRKNRHSDKLSIKFYVTAPVKQVYIKHSECFLTYLTEILLKTAKDFFIFMLSLESKKFIRFQFTNLDSISEDFQISISHTVYCKIQYSFLLKLFTPGYLNQMYVPQK